MKQYQKSIDYFRFIAACMVVAVHTAPLIGINSFANYFLVQIVARVAVPFFFCTSGYYYFRKLKKAGPLKALQSFLFQNMKYYLAASLIYIPFYIVNHPDFNILSLVGDIFYQGFHYHLWYFPAIMLAAILVTTLYVYLRKYMFAILMVLYVFGSLLNVYLPLLPEGMLLNGLQTILNFISTARNGIFFAPIFFYLGFTVQERKTTDNKLFYLTMLYLIEGLLVEGLKIGNSYTCMYLSLVLLIPTLVETLLQKKSYTSNALFHQLPLLVYILHPAVIVVVEKIYTYFKLDLPALLLFLYTVSLSSILALLIASIMVKANNKRQKELEISEDNDIIEKYKLS